MILQFIKKRWKHLLPIIGIFLLSLLWVQAAVLLPSEISLRAGQKENFQFQLPVTAKVADEYVDVLQVNATNATPIERNIQIDTSIVTKKQTAKVSFSLFGLVPVKTVNANILPQTEIYPCGMAVGVSLNTNGIMVLGVGSVDGENNEIIEPAKGILKTGDLIVKANNKVLESKEDLMTALKDNNGQPVAFEILRKGEEKTVAITPIYSPQDNNYKIGAWVRDSAQGIGTVTYVDAKKGSFGALGHGVYDIDTKELMEIKKGTIYHSSITEVKKGEKGIPGELLGSSKSNDVLGQIRINTEVGLYGKTTNALSLAYSKTPMPIGLKQDIHTGKASILSNIQGGKVEEFQVEIESVSKVTGDTSKGMILKITDQRLLEKTGGIVQGMSGSPILQDGKIIGAVTHVFVQDPTRGYGIFIENMLKEEKNAL